ncbi:hypothetical protein Val02_57850 [Virgisporangium aliadipatigenens]|uniref:Uncharacterized protein n=1 Tax=Virgisporangium aliadipatigenens TaxID=741659 RepID=A0A8J3YNP2_9ACTN|nr:hypothetical protein [Virgisporangium aliadipatigenens]GIJ48899.1 hypothetical protein Val02_57850 [Virgisporangium aliadipatigenens]
MRFLFGNWFSRAYLLLVAATTVFVVWSYATYEGSDANLAGVLLFFVTAPTSFVFIGVLGSVVDSPVGAIVYLVACTLVNTALISALVHGVKRLITRHRPAT